MEVINLSLHDTEYKNVGYTHTRLIARGFVLNEENKICLLHIVGDDDFGHRDYYETPGGGVEDGEGLREALIRELDEEIGYECKILSYLGVVYDEYNLIKRKNVNNYFLCSIVKKTKPHHVSYGDLFIKEICFFDIEEAIQKYEAMNKNMVQKLVYNREYPILKKIKQILKDSDLKWKNVLLIKNYMK